MISIVGGIYREICTWPRWNEAYGSAGRAALALHPLHTTVELFAEVGSRDRKKIEDHFKVEGIATSFFDIGQSLEFHYDTPASIPRILSTEDSEFLEHHLNVKSNVVLYYGNYTLNPRIVAEKIIYDPQTGINTEAYDASPFDAKSITICGNQTEICALGQDDNFYAAAKKLLAEESVDVVVTKLGPQGALVFTANNESRVYPYQVSRARANFLIGSGDIFSAFFALTWGCKGAGAGNAADEASKFVAAYSANYSKENLPIALPAKESIRRVKIGTGLEDVDEVLSSQVVYLAGPFFSLEERWLRNHALDRLEDLGLTVFSPEHAVGYGTDSEIAKKDLLGLKRSNIVLALLNTRDLGTIFEIGWKVKQNAKSKIIIYSENMEKMEETMLKSGEYEICRDFSSALYSTYWSALR